MLYSAVITLQLLNSLPYPLFTVFLILMLYISGILFLQYHSSIVSFNLFLLALYYPSGVSLPSVTALVQALSRHVA
jgi:hypothetical protein